MRWTTWATVVGAALSLAACGGGGGGGGGATTIPPGATPLPSSPPVPSTLGDVRVLAQFGAALAIAYDDDDRLAFLSQGRGFTTVGGGGGAAIALPSSDASPYVTAATYSRGDRALYFAGFNTIYRSTVAGAVTTVASGFGQISSIALDPGGNVYVVDGDHVATVTNGTARSLTPPGTFAPNPSSLIGMPQIAFDTHDGALYATDPFGATVKRIALSGAVSVIAGSCAKYFGGGQPYCWPGMLAGTGAGARFGTPSGLAYDASRDIFYVGDANDNVIWSMTPGGTTEIIAGYGAAGLFNGNGRGALLIGPVSLALSSTTSLLYMDELDPFGRTSSVGSLATSGTAPPSSPIAALVLGTPSALSQPQSLALAPDGTAWITEIIANKVGHVTPAGITEFTSPAGINQPYQITVDASGGAWSTAYTFTGPGIPTGAAVFRTAADGAQTAYRFASTGGPAQIGGIATGSDGNPWFGLLDFTPSGPAASIETVDRTSGVHTSHPLSNVKVRALGAGPDGNIWFTTFPASTVLLSRMATDGHLVGQPFPLARSPLVMTPNFVDHSLWFVDASTTLGRVDLNGTETDFSLCVACGAQPGPNSVATAPDGTMWFTETNPPDLGHRDAAGNVTRYLLPRPAPQGIAVRADGKLWVASLYDTVFLFDPAAYDALQIPHTSGHSVDRSPRSVNLRALFSAPRPPLNAGVPRRR